MNFLNNKLLDLNQTGTRRTGERGRCYKFDGVDDIVISNYQDLNLKGDLVLACRFNWDNGSASDKFLISFAAGGETENANVQYSIFLQASSGNELQYFHEYGAGTNEIVSLGWTPDPDVNYNLVVTRDSVNKVIKAYINGSEVGSNTYTKDPTGGSSAVFGIGRLNGSPVPFSGKIWDVRIYDGVWSTDNIDYYCSKGNTGTQGNVLGWWKSDEQSGTVAYDSSGNGYHGTITNATLATFHATQDIWSFQNQVGYNLNGSVYIPRDESDPTNDVLGNTLNYAGQRPNDGALKQSNCLDLNGTNQVVRVADDPAFDITDNLTVSIWAKNDNSSIPSSQILFGKYDYGVNKREWVILLNNLNKIAITLSSDGSSTGNIASDSAVSDINQWHHYAFTFNNGTCILYLDGAEVASSVTAGSIPSSLQNSDTDVIVGSVLNGGSITLPWDGQTLDARIYNRVLSESEIQSIYEDSTNLTSDSNLVGRWKCQEGAGAICHDSSGNENHGTIENAASNWGIKQDKVHSNLLEGHGKRMYFDGVGASISVSNNSSLNFGTSDFVIEATFVTKASGAFFRILDKRDLTYGYTVSVDNNNVIRLELNDGSGNSGFVGNTIVNDGIKHTIRIEADRSGNALFYLDGVLDATRDISSKNGNLDSTSDLYIGADAPNGNFLFFQGIIYSVYIEVDGVQVLSHNGYGNKDADWIDQSGNGNDGTVNGSPSNIYLPSKSSTLDIFDQNLTDPAGKWINRAETVIDFNPDSTPEMINFGDYTVPSSYKFGDIIDYKYEQAFKRELSSTKEDKILLYKQPITGSDNQVLKTYNSIDFTGKFISTWNTSNTGTSNSDQITLPLISSGTYNMTVNWGDGTQSKITAYDQSEVTHTFPSSGIYTITITGTCQGWRFNNGGDKDKIIWISNWGSLDISTDAAFFGCINLNSNATDSPTISTTSLRECFRDCTSLKKGVSGWSVGTNVTNLSYTFNECAVFNDDISSWNVSNVTIFFEMFKDCQLFNQDISGWDVSSGTSFIGMFRGASAFNQNIGSWNTSNATRMDYMFRDAIAFNQDIGSWDVSSVQDMYQMFNSAESFDQDISSWDITSCTDMELMFIGATLSTANYDALLIGWESYGASLPTGQTFHGGNSTYTAGGAAEAARTSLSTTYGWLITDGGTA
jgi:surface protein